MSEIIAGGLRRIRQGLADLTTHGAAGRADDFRSSASTAGLPGASGTRHAWSPVRIAVLAIAGLGAAAMVALFAGGREVATVLAKRGSAAEVVYATGVVEPVYWAKVTALQRKRIVEICKCEGQAVKQGDVLARLDDIEERAHKNELEARLQRLKDDAERLTTLVQRNIASRTSLEEKLTQVREQQARVAAQQDRIADLALKAPIDGVVLRRDGEVGEIAGTAAGDTLLWVGQPKPLQVVAEVNEDDILRVAKGQTALLRHEGYSAGPMRATVSRLTPKGDPQSKTFRVYLALPDETPLKIGMSVEANIVVGEVDDGVIVPAEAVVDHKVLKVRDGRVIIVPVEVGIRGAGAVEIRSGIAAGDELISPYDKGIASGTRVDAVRRQAASP